jgi:hypothetical protein
MCTSMKFPYPVETQWCNVASGRLPHSLNQLIVKIKGQVVVVVEIITCEAGSCGSKPSAKT